MVTSKDAGLGTGARESQVNCLPKGGSYRVQIDAVNGPDLVGRSALLSFTTANGATVSNLFAPPANIKQQEFQLTWTFGGDVSGLKQIRVIRQNPSSQGLLGTPKTQFTNMQHTVTGLNRNTVYNVFLRIVYLDGTIEESDSIEVRTRN